MWFYSDSFCVIQLIVWICTFGSRHLCCTCPAFWCLKRYQEPLLQQCIFGIHCGFDGDHHCNELVSSCTGEFCCSGLLPFHPLISVISEILIWSFWGHMQPALLYIVPGVIGFVAVHCLWNGEVKQVRFWILTATVAFYLRPSTLWPFHLYILVSVLSVLLRIKCASILFLPV